MMSLTERQADALRFITGFVKANGYCPSVREIGAGIGVAGMLTIQEVLEDLEVAGAIRSLPRKHRAIEVLAPIEVPRGPEGEPLYFVRVGESAL